MDPDAPKEGSQDSGPVEAKIEKMRGYLRAHAQSLLEDPNISSVGIG